ncbi:MAG: PEPxxWA-CTERM sorting domain-containing protein [Phenylobacterium sp.]
MFTDDPTIPGLVFTYIGLDFQTSGGPFPSVTFTGLTATSTLGGLTLNGFSSRAISNDGMGTVGTASFNNGAVGVAAIGLPEPTSWALLIVGFGGAGTLLRARRRKAVQFFA